MTMRRRFSRSWVVLACLIMVGSGCGRDPFAPPGRIKPSPSVGESVGSKPAFLVMVLPSYPTVDMEVWGLRAQNEANLKRVVFRIMGPAPNETPAKQPEVVRNSVADGASALIVYPGDAPDLPAALAEAEAKGVPVVLIEKPLEAPAGSKPFTVVEHAPFEDSAKRIVTTTLDDLKKVGRAPKGTVLLLVDKVTDNTSSRRVAALKSAAEAAGVGPIVDVSFDGSNESSAKSAVIEAVKANPDVAIVLTDDMEGLLGAGLARIEFKGKPVFFAGGFADYRSSKIMMPPDKESCVVEGRYSELGGLAVITALGRLDGKPAGEHLFVTPKFTKTAGAVWSEADDVTPDQKALRNVRETFKERDPSPGGSKP